MRGQPRRARREAGTVTARPVEARGFAGVGGAGVAAVVAAAAVMVALIVLAHLDPDNRGVGGVLRFREDGRGVTALGSAILALFVAVTSLGVGAFVTGGARRLAAPASVLTKVTILIAVVFMFAFPDLSQFEAKSLTWRAIVYPTLAFAVPVLWLIRARDRPVPWLFDLVVGYVVTFDIVSNDLHWYGTWDDWDDFVHFSNSIPFIVVVTAPLLTAERRGAFRLGFWGVMVFALTIYITLHTFWEMWEFALDRFLGTNLQPGGMAEATTNNVTGIVGALIGVGVMAWWARRSALDANLVGPLSGFWSGVRGR